MKTHKFISIAVCIFTASLCYSQSKTISNIPAMNSNEYSWCSRQVFVVDIDSLAKAYNSLMGNYTLTVNAEYRNKSKLLVDELLNLISLDKMKAYSFEGTTLTNTDVSKILSENVLVKETGSKKMINGLQKQNITTFRIVEDVYINKKTLKIETKPLALIPYAVVYDNNGETKGVQPLFYIYF